MRANWTSRRKWTGRVAARWLPAALLPFCLWANAAADSGTEDRITAAFVYNFCKFVQWPGEPADTLVLAVLDGPEGAARFGDLDGKPVGASTLSVAAVKELSDAALPSVVFISEAGASEISGVLAQIGNRPVLTVSNCDGFCESGGMIQLETVRGKMRFSINAGAAERAGLGISSQLMKMAVRIVEGD